MESRADSTTSTAENAAEMDDFGVKSNPNVNVHPQDKLENSGELPQSPLSTAFTSQEEEEIFSVRTTTVERTVFQKKQTSEMKNIDHDKERDHYSQQDDCGAPLRDANSPSLHIKQKRELTGRAKCYFIVLVSLLVLIIIIGVILMTFYPTRASNAEPKCKQVLADFRNLNKTLRYFKSKNWDLVLHTAIDDGDETAVKILIDLGAQVNGKNNRSETPLHRAALCNDKSVGLRIIKLLVGNLADVFAKDKDGNTFLHKLVDDGTTLTPKTFNDAADFLISRNLSKLFNIPGGKLLKGLKTTRAALQYKFYTPFQLAVKNLDVETDTLMLLHRNGVNFTAVDSLGRSLLNYAVAGGRSPKLLSDLVALGADWKHLDNNNATLLHEAALYGNLGASKFLISLGMNINSLSATNDNTPLHWVILYSKDNVLETVRFLLKNGADPKIKNESGDTPLDKAMRRYDKVDKDKIIQLLRNSQ